ncbi:hypothetical protein N7532_000520 [Penicillium argentinense]|uniref:Major facilitator superfamily (MFS) profile domain-containing protein n=1 Tax=Penicillium argentinense TaxID=1131581 RepID=A0A9W9G6A7_9EURO|nr:uncharacterized protein N7532_000520 [Penicillium argentinense]KAJ5112475.1 hypothetical protein N7532_000520 [Penicillium argentinense]
MRVIISSKVIPHNRHPPWLFRVRSSTSFIITTVWMSTFTDFLLYAMIVPVMPSALMTRASVEYNDREYWISVLLMCEAGASLLLCPVFGYLVDTARTRKLPFVGALVMLACSMAILQVSHSLAMFIAGRLLQGAAGALVVVAGFAVLSDSVSQECLGQTIGYLGSAIASGFLLGPFFGGFVYDTLGYDAVFWVTHAIIVVDLTLRVAMIEKGTVALWMQKPDGGAVLNTDHEAESGTVLESDHSSGLNRFPMVQMLKQRRVLISSWALLVHGILLSAFDATLSIFVETRYGWSALGMGLIFLPLAIPAFFEPLFGYITDRYGARFVAFAFFFLLSPTLICLRFVEANTPPNIALLVILLLLSGIFIHGCAPAMYVETQLALAEMELERPDSLGKKGAVAQGFGLQCMCQFIGVFFGPLWGGFMNHQFGWETMSGTLGVLAALTAMSMLFLGEFEDGYEEDGERRPLFG